MKTTSPETPDLPDNSPSTESQEFVILGHSGDSWQVRLSIPSRELVDQEALLSHLRKVKAEIARMYTISESDLYFGDITRREAHEDFVDVVVSILTQVRTFGEPRICFRPEVRGHVVYPNMTAVLNIAYLDEHKQPITMEKVMETIQKAGVDPSLLNQAVLSQAMNLVLSKHTSASNVIVARGKLPETGHNAEIELKFPTEIPRESTNEYLLSRQVGIGETLGRKQPPTLGGSDGCDVTGKCIPARAGYDTQLIAGIGTELSPDGLGVVSRNNGVATVARVTKMIQTPEGPVEAPASVQIKVNQITQVRGNTVVHLNSSNTVEVSGSLHAGSHIVTEGEVIVSGDVQKNSTIEAVDTIAVNGKIRGASLNSQNNILAWNNVENAKLVARGQILTRGSVHRSELTADSIHADRISACQLIARNNISLLSAELDEDQIMSTICVGINEFLKYRIEENNRFVDASKSTLTRMESVFGKSLVAQANRSTVQILFMRFLSQLPMSNVEKKRRASTYRSLIESIPPMQQLIKTKRDEIKDLLSMLDSQLSDGGLLTVRDRLSAPMKVSISGQQTTLREGTGPLRVRRDGVGALLVEEQ